MKRNDFYPKPDDAMIRFPYPNGWIELNQRWMETAPKGRITAIMKNIDQANRQKGKRK